VTFPERPQLDELSAHWNEEFQGFVSRAVAAEGALLEAYCEAALLSGEYGVRVVSGVPELTLEVPYGTIHDYPSGRDAQE
jgi:hypothetical protein